MQNLCSSASLAYTILAPFACVVPSAWSHFSSVVIRILAVLQSLVQIFLPVWGSFWLLWSTLFPLRISIHCCCCSVPKSCLTLWDPMDCSTPGFLHLHYLPELAKTHVQQVGDAIQPSHPLSPPSPPAFNLSWHQGLFQQVCSSHQVADVLELQLQHQSF